ncbi:hypothetical protein [Hallella bergensis]|uniref:hypothetical protein n=1 Tax=Hallella bergensis TaxID=242750 RepID=UPI003211F695
MKLKNIVYTMVGAVTLTLGTSSCSDSYLDEKMYSSYGTDVSDVNAKVLGLHYKIAQIYGWSGHQGFVGCWQVGTDVGSPGDTEGVEVPFYKYAELNSENAGVSFFWQRLYEIINAANIIIATPDAAPALVGEARFFRAYAY